MCGITGFCDFNFISDENVLTEMTNKLQHRGPDFNATQIWNHSKCTLGFGHTRLSIIDLSAEANQPMSFNNEKYWIVFNGEIYNYKSLANDLVKKGFAVSGRSDTETILAMYQYKGMDMLHDLRGMFAFVIYDKTNNKLVAARDRSGVKPFYYYYKNGLFLFGSELKSICSHNGWEKKLNINALGNYFKHNYIAGNESIYQEVRKLEKGHTLLLNLDSGQLDIQPYFTIEGIYSQNKKSNRVDLDELKSKFVESLKLRFVSDVPVGIYQSGGYDSTLITALATQELGRSCKAYTIGFRSKEFDESELSTEIAKHFDIPHSVFMCEEADARELIPLLPDVFDEPFADPSAIPSLLLSKYASNDVRVILSGDGNDEHFGGYNRYGQYLSAIERFSPVNHSFFSKIIPESAKHKYAKLHLLGGDIHNYLNRANSQMSNPDLCRLILKWNHHERNMALRENPQDLRDLILLWDINNYLPDNVMVKVDRTTMHYSMEAREPWLDVELINYASTLSLDDKINSNGLKWPIRELLHTYIPKETMDKPKRGFSPPIGDWLDGSLSEEFNDLSNQSSIKKQGIFDYNFISTLLKTMPEDYLKHRFKWALYCFQKWHTKWM